LIRLGRGEKRHLHAHAGVDLLDVARRLELIPALLRAEHRRNSADGLDMQVSSR